MLSDAQRLCTNLYPCLHCPRMPVAVWPCQLLAQSLSLRSACLCMCLEGDLQTSVRNWWKIRTFSEKCYFTLKYFPYNFSVFTSWSQVTWFLLLTSQSPFLSCFCFVDLGALASLMIRVVVELWPIVHPPKPVIRDDNAMKSTKKSDLLTVKWVIY